MKTELAQVHRQTKYCKAIQVTLSRLGHATNAELLHELQKTYLEVSATTIHRATARLADRGEIGVAPSSHKGSLCYDANTTPHDHFQCTECGRLRDADLIDHVAPILEAALEECRVSGRLTIGGVCSNCSGGLHV